MGGVDAKYNLIELEKVLRGVVHGSRGTEVREIHDCIVESVENGRGSALLDC